MSFGVICFREVAGRVEYIMIQRKDSLCFMEFVRGKYDCANLNYVQGLFCNMTADERQTILTSSFEELWNQVWFQPFIARHTMEFLEAKRKYDALMLLGMHKMIENTPPFYSEPEWGFPKGRRRLREQDVDCAVREFSEETGFSKDDIRMVDCPPIEEIFYGTNNILYKHVYYIAYLHKNFDRTITVDPNNIHQAREVRRVEWFPFDVAFDLIRSHNQERKALFTDVNSYVQNYFTQQARDHRELACRLASQRFGSYLNFSSNLNFNSYIGYQDYWTLPPSAYP